MTRLARYLKLVPLLAAATPLLVACARRDPWMALTSIPLLIAGLGLLRGATWGAFLLLGSGATLGLLAGAGAVHWSGAVAGAIALLGFAALVPLLLRFDALATVLLTLATGGLGAVAASMTTPTADPDPRAAHTSPRELPAEADFVVSSVDVVLSSPNCWVDAVVQKGLPELLQGNAGPVIRFGEVEIPLRREGDRFVATYRTSFEFEDGCKWDTEQHLSGSLEDRKFSFRYTERPRPGQRGCAPACTASAEFRPGCLSCIR